MYVHEYVTDLLVWNFRTENEAITRGMEAGLQLKNKNIFILINLNSFRNLNDIDKEIFIYLTKLRSLKPIKLKKRLSIKCCRIGYIGEYHSNQCHKKLEQVERAKFLINN